MKDELERLNQAWTQAWLDRDGSAVDRIMAAEYTYIAPTGEDLDRGTILSIIQSPTYRLAWGRRTEVSVISAAPDTGVLLCRWQGEGAYEGRTFNDDHRVTTVCVRRASGWQMILEHCTSVLPPSNG